MKIANQSYEMVPVGLLKTHPRNPRRGDVGLIAESVRQNGFFGAVVVQADTDYILAGNHRYLAAVQEGATEIPVVYVDCDEEQALRILLADNRTSDTAHYDEATLGELLKMLAESGDGLAGTGYNEADVEALLAAFEDPDDDGGGGGASPTAPPLQIVVLVEASEHLVDATHAIATFLGEHPEWRARVG